MRNPFIALLFSCAAALAIACNGDPPTRPVLGLNASSPAGAMSPGNNQVVAVFNVTAAGERDLSLNTLTLVRSGSAGEAVIAPPTVWGASQLLATGEGWSGESKSIVRLTSPLVVSAGQTVALAVKLDTIGIETGTLLIAVESVTYGPVCDVRVMAVGFYGNTLVY